MPKTKSATFTLIAFLLSLSVHSQIINPGFDQEQGETSSSLAPWKVKTVEGYEYVLDKSVKHSGASALKLTSKENKEGTYMPFSQKVPIKVEQSKRILVTAFIKCADVKDEATLWCQILDENDKMIGFQNLEGQGAKISGTLDWKKYTMSVTLNVNARKLLLGGYLSGTGTAWFDDFEIKEVSQNTPASESVTAYVNDFIRIVKQNSLFTDSLNWPLIEKEVVTFSAGLNRVDEARPIVDYIIGKLKAVGDNHSFIQNKVTAERYTKENSNSAKPEAKLISGNIGYVSVPGFGTTNSDVSVRFATDIQNMIRKLDTENQIRGWIVDLRNNTGGNMYPMIAGLGPLIGESTLGYFIKKVDNKEAKNTWFYKNGGSGIGSGTIVRVPNPYKIKNKTVKIAVLIGAKTSSSGEMTAISFIGKRKTKLFGSLTGGYTTANGSFKLSDGSNLLLASTYTADRNMKRYMKKISPDVVVSQHADGTDADLKAATAWLLDLHQAY
ncbi:S41 family peptidase [Pedobacter steynii]